MTARPPTYDYLTATEAARLLRVRESKVLAWLRSGELPGADVSERPGQGRARWRISRDDLNEFLRRRQLTPAAKPTKRRPRAKRPAGWVEYV
jgi:excisionase family DNA binding protein